MHVHCLFRNDLGSIRLGGDRRDIPAAHSRKASFPFDCIQLARYVWESTVALRHMTNVNPGNFLLAFLTPFANDGIGYAFGYVFVACNLAAAVVVYFFLYESKSLSLENVDAMYSEPALKAWKSKGWVPPGYIDRKTRDQTYFQQMTSTVEDGIGGLGKDAVSDEEKSAISPVGRSAHQETL
jgi:hypothetical protein